MRLSSNSLCVLVLLFTLVSQTYGVSDENICDTQCDYCCRDKVCRSEDDCKGNFQPFVILGIVAGAIVGLFVLRKVYLYLKQQNAKKVKENSNKKSSRASRTRTKEKKEKVSKSKPSRSKSMKKEEKKSLKEDIYLQVDNDSVISPDSSVVKNEATSQDLEKGAKKGEVNIKSKTEIKDNVLDADKKDDKKMDMKASSASTKPKPDPKKSDKTSSKKMTSSSSSKKPTGSSKAGAKGGEKERGRSTGRDGDKGRSTSQKKPGTSKDDKASKAKKNQV